MKQLILVDACNMFHRVEAFRHRLGEGIDSLADQLLQQLRPLHDLENAELHVVVDGSGPRMEQVFHDPGRTLSVIFSPADQSADTIIESWLIRLGPGWSVHVASEDRAIVHSTIAHGAEPLSAQQLFERLERARARFARQQQLQLRKSSQSFGNRLEGLP